MLAIYHTRTFGIAHDKNVGRSVGMQSKVTSGCETCGNIGSFVT